MYWLLVIPQVWLLWKDLHVTTSSSSNSLFSSTKEKKNLCTNSKAHNVTWVFTRSQFVHQIWPWWHNAVTSVWLHLRNGPDMLFLNRWDMLTAPGRERHMSTFLSPVKPPRDQTCWSEGGVQGACQQNRPISEQLVVLLHQATLEVVGRQGGKHLEGDWEKDNANIIMDFEILSVLLLPFNDFKRINDWLYR